MKKKIKDLTLAEIRQMCDKRVRSGAFCDGCLLHRPYSNLYCPIVEKELLEKEIEIDEKD